MIFGPLRTPSQAAHVLGVAAGISRGRARIARCQATKTVSFSGRSGPAGLEKEGALTAEEGAGAAASAPGSGGALGVSVALGRDELGAGAPRGCPCR